MVPGNFFGSRLLDRFEDAFGHRLVRDKRLDAEPDFRVGGMQGGQGAGNQVGSGDRVGGDADRPVDGHPSLGTEHRIGRVIPI